MRTDRQMFKTGVLRNGEAQFAFVAVEYDAGRGRGTRVTYAMVSHGTLEELLFDRGLEWDMGPTYFDVGHQCTHGEVVYPRDTSRKELHVMVDFVTAPFISRSIGLANLLAPYADFPFKLAGLSCIFGTALAVVLFIVLHAFRDDPGIDSLYMLGASLGGVFLLAAFDWGYWRRDRTLKWWEEQRHMREELESLRSERRSMRYQRRLEREQRRRSKRRRAGGRRAGQEAALDALDPCVMEYGVSVSTAVPVKQRRNSRAGSSRSLASSAVDSASEDTGSEGETSDGDVDAVVGAGTRAAVPATAV